ncbi:PLP-dependent aminotransferase family protein [Saccharothrix syringae]|uniref:PLP-dependent aminotransferase family protein n=2 Tax=Saccharothrix syringae TaxID=103733 RepID=A0A5Q0HE78_SACSY|nr:PLP-dependent aminotransferase family protein [Saccharothrix syringae]
MNFLNEVAGRFPGAVSLAAGRPADHTHDVEALHSHLRTYCAHLRDARGYDEREVARELFQYGRTKGVVHELIAAGLRVDENIDADPESVVVTVGCQEALLLTLRALRRDAADVLLAASPMYVGVIGAAALVDLPVVPVPEGPDGLDPGDLRDAVRAARDRGLRPRACYLVPDFANPSGTTLPVEVRKELLALADDEDFLVLEDNPYGLFPLGEERLPTVKSLDDRRRVVYLASLAKSCFPGARVGFAVADQVVRDRRTGARRLFADELAKLKSMATVNTSPIAQALVAGRLLEHGGSLLAGTAADRAAYRRNLRLLLDGLARRFPAGGGHGVSWNSPGGGFFVVVTVPFVADDAALERSARAHGVLWTPMSHFYPAGGGERQLRLSCSAVGPDGIEDGLDRLAAFITTSTERGVG